MSGWLKRKYKENPEMYISHETIYKSLYIQSRNVLSKHLMCHLRRDHKMRQTKKHSTKGDCGSINTVNGLSIHERTDEIKHRKTCGHWERDLISAPL